MGKNDGSFSDLSLPDSFLSKPPMLKIQLQDLDSTRKGIIFIVN